MQEPWRSEREKKKKLLGRIGWRLGTNCALLHYEATFKSNKIHIHILSLYMQSRYMSAMLFKSTLKFMRKRRKNKNFTLRPSVTDKSRMVLPLSNTNNSTAATTRRRQCQDGSRWIH